MNRQNEPRRTGPRRRIRFPNPTASEPERWTIRKVTGGRYAIVDSDGVPVLDHWDPVVRTFNRHLAKAAPVQRFALVHAQRFIERLESPFAEWLLVLIGDALREGIPHVAGAVQAQSEVKELEAA